MADAINENEQEHDEDGMMGSPLASPEKKKFNMKIRGDCFLYTSFYMIKKWFLVMVAVHNYPQFEQSLIKMFKFETTDKWFILGFIFALPALIPVAGLFIGLALLLLALFLMTFLLACFLILILVVLLDLPLLIVLVIQAFLFGELLTNIEEITDLDWSGFLIYLQISLLLVALYNCLQEVSNAMDNALFMTQHYKKRKDLSVFFLLFIIVSILPQVLQILSVGIISYFAPQVILSATDIISAFQNFSFLYIIIKVNTFMTTFLRETKWYNLHWFLFKYLETINKVSPIHVTADEMHTKIYELKRNKVYQVKKFGFLFDTDFINDFGVYVVKLLCKLLMVGLFVGMFLSMLSDYYSTDSSSA